MSRDIRSFFSVVSKKSSTEPAKPVPSATKKKTRRLIDSDDDDIILSTPETKKQKHDALSPNSKCETSKKKFTSQSDKTKSTESKTEKSLKKAKKKVLSSSSEDEIFEDKNYKNKDAAGTSKSQAKNVPDKSIEVISSDSETDAFKIQTKKPVDKKINTQSKLKPVNVADIFKKTPIKQTNVDPPRTENKVTKSKSKDKGDKNKEKTVHNDTDFEKTLDDLDDDLFVNNIDILEKSVTEALSHEDDEKAKSSNSENQENKNGVKRARTDSTDRKTPKKKKVEHVDSGIDPGQEAHEKKRYSAMLYQKYLNRSGPKHHGIKKLPKGNPTCLSGLCFLKTGVLDSLESEEFEKLIKEHGGRVVHGVSKKVNYLVVGEDAGPAKLAKAESYSIPSISEDELLDLILTKSGMEPKYCTRNNSAISDDLGFETDGESVEVINEKVKDKELDTNTDDMKTNPEVKPKQIKTKDFKECEHEQTSVKEPKSGTTKKATKSNDIPSGTFYSQVTNKELESTQNSVISQGTQSIGNNSSFLPLSEKYRPQTFKAIIGQQSESSNLFKLKNWLQNWHKNQDPKNKKSKVQPNPWQKNSDGAYYKSALLSGAPGVGKTTTATLVAKELGFDVVEFNASDTRSKKLLHEEVAQLLQTKTIAAFAKGRQDMETKRVLLMDEVDGMAGNEDRGGIQELIQLIKTTKIPIICMCNDRNHQKMRALVNYCYDLRFVKPRLEQIRGAMLSVCFKEKIDISPQALSEIIAGTGCDIRQTLNHLAILGSTKEKITPEVAGKEAKSSKKDVIMGPWEVCRTVFTKTEHKDMSVADKARLFFFDYSLGPLFVQENYLKVQPQETDKKQTLLKAALTAASISTGDIFESKIRKQNNWSLLESQAFYSSVLPGHYMSGNFTGQINFPTWLGNNSKKGKFSRLQSEIQYHTLISTSASKLAIKLDYLIPLRNGVLAPLIKKGMEGIDQAVSLMKSYNVLREDVDSLAELCQWMSKENSLSMVDTKVKTAFTRTYNKQVTLLPFAPSSGAAKKRSAAAKSDPYGEEDEEAVSDEENGDNENTMFKVKKKSTGKGKKGDETSGKNKKTESKRGKAKKAK